MPQRLKFEDKEADVKALLVELPNNKYGCIHEICNDRVHKFNSIAAHREHALLVHLGCKGYRVRKKTHQCNYCDKKFDAYESLRP